MTTTTAERLLRIVLFLRSKVSPTLYSRYYKVPIVRPCWEEMKKLTMKQFSTEINTDAKYGYKWDLLHGLIDSSFDPAEPDYFFQQLKKGRDCDDYARIWRLWGEANGFAGEEIIVTDAKHPFSRAHCVAILNNAKGYWLMNYIPYGPYSTYEEATAALTAWYPTNMVWAAYDHTQEVHSDGVSR
jgi:hypothetical protein